MGIPSINILFTGTLSGRFGNFQHRLGVGQGRENILIIKLKAIEVKWHKNSIGQD